MRAWLSIAILVGCTQAPPGASRDAGTIDGARAAVDAAAAAIDGPIDASIACASSAGEPGECLDVSTCAALGDHQSEPGHCPGPTSIQCCVVTPNVADNPPVPAGYQLMSQADVTPDMTAWAVGILHDPVTYPMFSTATRTFGTLTVLARVEWHPPDFQNHTVHRGVTLYEPI